MPTIITRDDMKVKPASEQRESVRALKRYMEIKEHAPYLLFDAYEGWQRDFFESKARTRVAHCGNRTGKTYACAADVALQLYKKHPIRKEHNHKRQMRVRVIAPDEEHSIKSWVEVFKQFIPKSHIIKDYTPGVSKTRRIDLDQEILGRPTSIDFMTHSMEVDQFESVELEIVVFDEVPPRQIYTACLIRTLAGGGCIMIAATPQTSTLDPAFFRELIVKLQSYPPEEAEVFCGSMYDAARAGVVEYDEEELKRRERDLTEDEIQIRIYGIPINVGGLVFKQFRSRMCTDTPPGHLFDPEVVWPGGDNQPCGVPPQDWQIVAGIDPSVNGYTGALWCAISPLDQRYYFQEYYQRDMTISQHAKAILEYEKRFKQEVEWRVIDPAANAQSQTDVGFERVIDQYAEAGVICMTDPSLRDEPARINLCNEALLMKGAEGHEKPNLYVSKELENFKRQLTQVSWQSRRDPNSANPYQKTQDKDNHLTDVFGLMEGMHPGYAPVSKYEPPPQRWPELGVA